MLNDIFLVRKIKEGDIKTYEHVFRFYYSQLKIYAFSITEREDIAEEVVQDLFYKIWKERESLQITRSLKSYLYTAVRNQSLQYWEHRNVQERHRQKVLADSENGTTVPETNPEEHLLYRELEDIISRTLARLPERRRQIFTLYRLEGKKYKEIAEDLSLSVKTVEAEMTKTYQILKQEIEKYLKS